MTSTSNTSILIYKELFKLHDMIQYIQRFEMSLAFLIQDSKYII